MHQEKEWQKPSFRLCLAVVIVIVCGWEYAIHQEAGRQRSAPPVIKASSVPPTASATPVAVSSPPRLPVIQIFPQRVHFELTNGSSGFGNVTAFDGKRYSITTDAVKRIINEPDIKTLELMPPKQ